MSTPNRSWIRRHPVITSIVAVILLGLSVIAFMAIRVMNAQPGAAGKYAGQIQSLVEDGQKDLPGPDGWAEFTKLVARIDEAEKAAVKAISHVGQDGKEKPPADWPESLDWPPSSVVVGTHESHPRVEALYRDLIASLHADGTFLQTAKLTERRKMVRPIPPGRMMQLDMHELSHARKLGRLNHARMMQGIEAGNTREVEAAFEESLALARIIGSQGTIMDRLIGTSISSLALENLRYFIAEGRLDIATLERMDAAIARQLPSPPITLWLEAERFTGLDTLEWMHSTSGVALAPSQLDTPTKGGWIGRAANLRGLLLASKEESAKVLDEFFALAKTSAQMPAHQRPRPLPADDLIENLSNRYAIVQIIVPAIGKVLASVSRSTCEISGTRVMIAIERFRKAKGTYPATLSELVPEFLSAVPPDEFDAGGFKYVVKDASAKVAADGYLLYSVGPDLTDNGGHPGPEDSPNVGDRGTDLSFAIRRYTPASNPPQ